MKALRQLYDLLGVSGPERRRRGRPASSEVGASQRDIAARIEAALAGDPDLAACPILVDVCGGVVELSGYANSEVEARRAEAIVSALSGVRAVRNHIALAWW